MKIIGIYKITAPNGSVYIGQSRDINARKKSYEKLKCESQPKIYNSIKKYGWENFNFEVILNCEIEELNKYEYEIHQKYLLELGQRKMLNLRVGGGQTIWVSKESCKKMSNSKKGKPRIFSENHRKKLSESLKGKKRSDEIKKRMSESRAKNKKHLSEDEYKLKEANKKSNFKKIKINQYDLNGSFLKTNNKYFIYKFYNNEIDNISNCCDGIKKSAYGFIWRYFNDYPDCNNLILEYSNNAINQYNLNGAFVKTWDSYIDITTFYDTDMSEIFKYININYKPVYNFIWRYYIDYSDCNNLIINNKKKRSKTLS